MVEEILTEEQLKQRLNVSRSLISKWKRQGMPIIRMGHRTVRFEYQTVLDWIIETFKRTPEKEG